MSDPRGIRTALGVVLLIGAALLLFLPLLPGPSGEVRYRPSRGREWALEETAGSTARETAVGKTVNVNRADAEELAALPGIGGVFADRIIEERREHGPFYYPEDLETVSGIGRRTVEKLRPLLDLTE